MGRNKSEVLDVGQTSLPLVSVIIPCYNSEKYLQETLDSVYKQTYPNIEIICVDNGSKDNTIDLIQKNQIQRKNLKFFQEPEKGASRARNLGLKNSKGEYIQFLDSDDIITPDKIEQQIKYVIEKDLDVVVSDRKVMDEKLINELESHTFEEIIEKPLETAITKVIITGNPIYRKETVLKVDGYTSELKMAQDYDFHLKLFITKPKIGYLKGFFLKCRNLEDSLSSNWVEVGEIGCRVMNQYRSKLMKENIHFDENVRKKIINSFFITAVHSKDKKEIPYYINSLNKWFKNENPCNFLSKINCVICRLFGLKGAIVIRRWLK